MSANPQPTGKQTGLRFAARVILKAVVLFMVVNLLFGMLVSPSALGKLSAYNTLLPGRKRLPYGDNPARAYNLSLYNLDAMFASHELAGKPKPAGEYRVIVVGDSASWGFLLQPDQTLAGAINQAGSVMPDGRQVQAYNLGYPVMSLTKDLVMLERALQYEPDLIVWPFTLESFPLDKQLFPPLLQNNPDAVRSLIDRYSLKLDPGALDLIPPNWWDRTIIGGRRQLADLLRLQLYGVLWAATGIDQDIPETYTPRQEDFEADASFHDLNPPQLKASDLAFEILAAGQRMAGDIPILFVNEPMFVSQGANSDIRYNFYYPRWAYDNYRRMLLDMSAAKGWHFLDAWDDVPNAEFTNSAVHMTPAGTQEFARLVLESIREIASSVTK